MVFAKVFTVKHNNDGTKTCNITVNGNSNFGLSFARTDNVVLDKIPRYTSIVNWAVSSKTHNSITFNWQTSDSISALDCKFNGSTQYSIDTLNQNSGSFTVPNLSENTTYSNIVITVKRKDSGLTTSSSAITETTYYTPPWAALSFHSSTINSITLNWSSNFVCDAIWIHNGGTQIYSAGGLNAGKGSVTLSPGNWPAISPNSTYPLSIKVRRKDSQATANSSVISTYTLPTPSINTTTPTSFNIGAGIAVGLSNSVNSNSSLIFQSYTTAGSWATVDTVEVSKGTNTVNLTPTASKLYLNCPNSNVLQTRIVCSVTSNSKTYTSYYYLNANVINSNPTFSDFSLQSNVGTDINNVIGGTTNILKDVGNLKVSFNTNSAAGLNSANITHMEIKVIFNNTVVFSNKIAYSASAFHYMCPLSAFTTTGLYTLQINALDSRGNRSSNISKSLNVYPYKKPGLDIKMKRQNEFGNITYIELGGEISKVTISGVQKNNIAFLKYRISESGGTFSDYEEITGYSSSSESNDILKITYNRTEDSNYFKYLDYEKSYVFQFLIKDNLSEPQLYEVFVAQGKPAFAAFGNGCVVVNKIPDFTTPAKLQVSSDIMAYDAKGKKDVLLVDEINKINDNFLNKTYPVGSIYMVSV